LRGPGIITKGLPELGHSLGQCVVGDICPGPKRVEQLLLRDQGARVVEQVQQEVQQLGSHLYNGVIPQHVITGAIDEKAAEVVAGTGHVR
jgi:hypothetical protein